MNNSCLWVVFRSCSFVDFSVFSQFLNVDALPKTEVEGLESSGSASKICYKNVFSQRALLCLSYLMAEQASNGH